jgi:BlaI family transcriptional regulator, penicillinase repressor
LRVLGELESRVMRVLWARKSPISVRDVHDQLAPDHSLAYTTVMTVMERLARKGLLRRKMKGRAFLYEPAETEAEYTARLMHELLRSTRDRKGALAHFVRGMRQADERQLRELADRAGRRKQTR